MILGLVNHGRLREPTAPAVHTNPGRQRRIVTNQNDGDERIFTADPTLAVEEERKKPFPLYGLTGGGKSLERTNNFVLYYMMSF